MSTSPQIPSVEVRYSDLRFSVPTSTTSASAAIPNVGSTAVAVASFPFKALGKLVLPKPKAALTSESSTSKNFTVLGGVSGVLRPGTLTLLIAPPGHGKSALMKALTQLLPPKELSGTVTYSGVSAQEAPGLGIHIGSLAQYVQQVDEHLPQLTVAETLQFVHDNCAVDPAKHGYPHLSGAHAGRVQDVMDLLHLNNCKDTIIGNDLVRGVSGGEKKRVTVAEGLLTQGRFLALDEISTGLDSAVTYDIVKRLRTRANTQDLTVLVTLLQPTPETYALFDSVILMREGEVVYHGPRLDLPSYLTHTLHLCPPTEDEAKAAMGESQGADIKAGENASTALSKDLADWLLQFLSDPSAVRAEERKVAAAAGGGTLGLHRVSSGNLGASGAASTGAGAGAGAASTSTSTSTPSTPPPTLKPTPTLPTTTEELVGAWRGSVEYASMLGQPPSAPPLALTGSYALQQYGSRGHAHSYLTHLHLLLGRQLKLMLRNLLYLRSRVASACIMSVILGGLYYQRTPIQGATLAGTFLNSLMLMGFSNMSEMAAAVENKFIAYRHVSKGIFPGATFVLSSAILHVPVALTETFIFTGVIYGMTGMQGAYMVYFFSVFLFDLVMRNLLVYFTLSARSLQAAQAMPLPVIAIFILFGGFLVTRAKMGWLTFVSYLDPITYGLRAMCINEFSAPAYTTPCTPTCPAGTTNLGSFFLQTFDMPHDFAWVWGGWGFMLGFILLCLLLQLRVFSVVRIDRNIGSARKSSGGGGGSSSLPSASPSSLTKSASGETLGGGGGEVSLAIPSTPPSATSSGSGSGSSKSVASTLPLTPMTLSFLDLEYTVTLGDKSVKKLLHGIKGYALPGRVLGLMGASGAGKTTLLDVLAGRKTAGKLTGAITLNGYLKEDATFNRIAAYVEQNDIHAPLATVREALAFSAALRLPSDITQGQREAFVEEILELLELKDAAGRIVGVAGSPSGLAPHERKRLTLGVELASNAPIIFLDEPTSGLDSRAAAIVMRVVKNVANSGRTIVCTVHQPSAELFFFFDDLLLLQRGGYEVFFGPIGPKASNLISYLGSQPGIKPCPPGMNPASWMLDSLQGLDSTATVTTTTAAAATATTATTTAAVSGVLAGPAMQGALMASPLGDSLVRRLEELCKPKAGGPGKLSFPTRFAASLGSQVVAVIGRQWVSMWRNVPLNFGRLVALTILNLMFGTIWYAIYSNADDLGGVQSLVSAVFMSAAFGAMVNMNTSVPVILAFRSVFYRESNSSMYDSLASSLAYFVCEVPYLSFIIAVPSTMSYFMFGLKSSPDIWAFHIFVSTTLAFVYVSLGSAVANIVPTFEVGQAILGLLGPLFFLFGGLWSPPSQMYIGARWFCYLDPITYTFQALIAQQFYCTNADPKTCPSVSTVVPVGNTIRSVTVPTYEYVSTKYEVYVEHKWDSLGYLALFIIFFQFVAFLSLRYLKHIKR